MAITVISKPEGLCFSGNLPKINVQSDGDLRMQLLAGIKVLLDETYTPDFDGLVNIDIADIVNHELTFTFPADNVYVQQNIMKNFVLKIDDSSYNFSAVRCGIKDFSGTPEIFLTKNFLTWQPKMKNITLQQSEYLTYFATQTCWLYFTAYFADGTKQNISVAQMTANNVYTVNINTLLNSLPKKSVKAEAAVCATNSIDADKISKYQYYTIVPELPDEQYFLFENSLGGLDTVRCTGEINHAPEFTRETALMGDAERTFFTEKKDIKTQTTGWLTRYDAAWLHDFFISKRIYLLENDKIKPVVIDEVTAETSSKENLISFEFTYRPAESSDYLIIYEKLTEYIAATFIYPVCQLIAEVIAYISAGYANPVCQLVEVTTTYPSAEYASPVCQLVEVTTTYPSAEYANAVCQVIDDSISYVSAEFTNPVCQQTEELLPDGIKLGINLKRSILTVMIWAYFHVFM
jgi:hypothetical protein